MNNTNPKRISTLQAEELSLGLCVPNEGQIAGLPTNPRIIRDAKYRALLKSIEEMPEMMSLRELLVYPHPKEDGTTEYVIIGGNMRYRALKELGHKTAPCKVLPEGTPVEFMRNVLLRDNSSYGEWDLDALANDFSMEELDAAAIDLPEVEEPKEEQEAQEDNYDVEANKPEQPKSRLGDMFSLGSHRLICGDSTDWKYVEKLIDGKQVDCIITDPPYNVNYEGGNGKKIENDHMSDKSFEDFLTAAMSNADKVMKAGAPFYVYTPQGHAMVQFMAALDKVGLYFRQQLIWVKNELVLGHMDYQWKHEPCLYGWKEGAGHYFINRRDLTTVQEDMASLDLDSMSKADLKDLLKKMLNQEIIPATIINENKPLKRHEHPTMKPLKLIGRQIRNSTRPGEIVLDLFGGSGSTMMAAEQLGRTCYMVEFDPKNVDAIVKRWEELTGKEAEYIGNINEIANTEAKTE